jgi:glucoamylase
MMPPNPNTYAPGWPGIPPRLTSSAKTGVGTAHSYQSPLWFTFSHGILNELFYPGVDKACTRDMEFIITDGKDFFSEEKRNAKSTANCLTEGVPAYRLINACSQGFYQIEKEILTDPQRPVLLQRTHFKSLKASPGGDYRLYVLLGAHLGNSGYGNTAWVEDYKGVPMLFAQRDGSALALACSVPWLKRSVGFVGFSDGWQDLTAHKKMTWEYPRAENGNVALTAEIDLQQTRGEFVIAIGFGRNAAEAANRARTSLQEGFDNVLKVYTRQWIEWQKSLLMLDEVSVNARKNVYRTSTIVMRSHESANFPGGMIASLAVPWGFSKGDEDLGGYHLVWPRDLVETAGGLLAAGAHENARRVLSFLQATQEEDGHWAQNMWLDGSPYWGGIQMDETALPILLMDLAWREKVLTTEDRSRFWPMIRQAAVYLLRNGPISPQDRWEEDGGYTPFTVGAEIAALLVAAEMADLNNEASMAVYLREVADDWYSAIDRWLYVSDTEWCRKYNVKGYYIRIATMNADVDVGVQENVLVKNVTCEKAFQLADHLVSPDALALVRFGLRAADDPRVLDTVKVIDALLKTDMPQGPIWHRYNGDGYGEHADGSPFDGTGIGRAWPLLTGERAHYELAAGKKEEADRLLKALENFSNEGGLIPEQTWDAADIPERELYFGRPSGSAMPLVWAHAEYVKLLRSLRDGRVFDMPPQTVQRYLVEKKTSPYVLWRFTYRRTTLPVGKSLRIETMAPAIIHWSDDNWTTKQDITAKDTGLGIYVVDLSTQHIADGKEIKFTFYWPETSHWEGTDFSIHVGG